EESVAPLVRPSLKGVPLPVLDRAELVRRLDNQGAEQGYPVRLRGVGTYYSPNENDCFVQDESAGIWNETTSTAQQGLDLEAGQFVEVEGYSEPGFAPSVTHPRFKILGRAAFPRREPVGLAHLLTAKEDGQWVKVAGLLLSVANEEGNLAFV